MNKTNIIEAIFQNNEYKRIDVENIVNQVFDQIIIGLIEDSKVMINNFGTFEKVKIKPYIGIHPITGEKMEIKNSYRINFNASNNLKTLIKK